MGKKIEQLSEEELIEKIFFQQRLNRVLVNGLTPFLPIMRVFYGALWYLFHGLTLGALWLRDCCSSALALTRLVDEVRPTIRRH